jgi:hypothetical protein
MVVGRKDGGLHEVDVAAANILEHANEERAFREAQYSLAPGFTLRYSQIFAVSFGLPLPPKMRRSSAFTMCEAP